MTEGILSSTFSQDTTIYECRCTSCRFNAINVHGGRDIAGYYCTFKSIDINNNCQCTMFEDMSDHGLDEMPIAGMSLYSKKQSPWVEE